MKLGQLYDCLSDSEVTLRDIGKIDLYQAKQNTMR